MKYYKIVTSSSAGELKKYKQRELVQSVRLRHNDTSESQSEPRKIIKTTDSSRESLNQQFIKMN